MLYPSCPKCGGKTYSLVDDEVPHGHEIVHVARHFPPLAILVGAVALIGAVGGAIYKRVPGGGEKKCEKCGHTFR